MKLKSLIALKEEVNQALNNYTDDLEVIVYNEKEELETRLKEGNSDLLLVAATDETIALGKACGVATLAYATEEFPNQTYSGVGMVVEGFEEVDVDFLEKVYQRFHHIPWKILETERCIVREISLADLDALYQLYDDEKLLEFVEPLYNYEEEKEFQRAYIENMYGFYGYGLWLVFLKETGELIGRAGLEHREIQEEIELELGYLIGTKFQGQGYATEVCGAIIEYAKEHTAFTGINCVMDEKNKASIELAKRLDFSQRESYDIDGKIMVRFVQDF